MIRELPTSTTRLPTHEQLDEYQSWVKHLIDDDIANGGRISKSGLHPIIYCCDGILEETEELTEHYTRGAKRYSRIAAILNAPQDVEATDIDTKRHQKEFGDTLWYAAGALALLDVNLSDTLDTQKIEHLPSIIEHLEISPGFELVSALDLLRRSAESFYRRRPLLKYKEGNELTIVTEPSEIRNMKLIVHRDERVIPKNNLLKSTGRFIVTSSRILETNFETTFEESLKQNIEKITNRIKNNTIEKRNGVGGDDR